MIEFLFIFLLFTSIVFVTLQFTIIANVRSLLNLSAYSATREYIVSCSSGKSQVAAAVYMAPFLPGIGNGEVLWVSVNAPSNPPAFGRQVDITTTAYYHLEMPLVRRYFGTAGYTGFIPLKSTCSMTMENSN
jgi:hypothetical protein